MTTVTLSIGHLFQVAYFCTKKIWKLWKFKIPPPKKRKEKSGSQRPLGCANDPGEKSWSTCNAMHWWLLQFSKHNIVGICRNTVISFLIIETFYMLVWITTFFIPAGNRILLGLLLINLKSLVQMDHYVTSVILEGTRQQMSRHQMRKFCIFSFLCQY